MNISIPLPNKLTPRTPFAIGGFSAVLSKERGDVLDANRVIASFVVNLDGRGTRVRTDAKYLRRGIAAELVYQVLKLNDKSVVDAVFSGVAQAKRTPEGQALYSKVKARMG
jgi:hypothetical protein